MTMPLPTTAALHPAVGSVAEEDQQQEAPSSSSQPPSFSADLKQRRRWSWREQQHDDPHPADRQGEGRGEACNHSQQEALEIGRQPALSALGAQLRQLLSG